MGKEIHIKLGEIAEAELKVLTHELKTESISKTIILAVSLLKSMHKHKQFGSKLLIKHKDGSYSEIVEFT